MAGEVDVVIEALGSNAFNPIGSSGINRKSYEAAVKLRRLQRTLLDISCGADPDLAPNVTDLVRRIDNAVGSQMSKLGCICLYGTSNGSGLILALAKALMDRNAPKIT